MASKYEEKVREEWEKFQSTEHFPNIMLLGVSGCGKSSLINRVFGRDLAKVNNVSRGTEEFSYYRGKNYGLKVNLIDSKGYEMETEDSVDNFTRYLNEVTKMIASKKDDVNDQIHMVWFCISVASNRIQQYDIDMIRELSKDNTGVKGKVAVVLTKCDEDDENGSVAKNFKDILHQQIAYDLPVFEVSTDINLPLEINDLIGWSVENLDSEDLKNAFVASQIVDIDQKRKHAAKCIAGYAVGAAAIAASPIPFSDSAVLVPEQLAMTTHIIGIYGMDTLASISRSVVSNIIITTIGRSLAGSLIKIIPVVGTMVGTIVNTTVATTLTAALGFAISEICYNCCKKIIRNESIDWDNIFNMDDIENLMKEFVRNNKNATSEADVETAIVGKREG